MLQVSFIGYAVSGAFLGLAYFDYYYDLIAVALIASQLVQTKHELQEAASPGGPGRPFAKNHSVVTAPPGPRGNRQVNLSSRRHGN